MSTTDDKIDQLALAVAGGFESVNKRFEEVDRRFDQMERRMNALREEVRSDINVLLDQHLQTYMHRYDELAARVKRLEKRAGI